MIYRQCTVLVKLGTAPSGKVSINCLVHLIMLDVGLRWRSKRFRWRLGTEVVVCWDFGGDILVLGGDV